MTTVDRRAVQEIVERFLPEGAGDLWDACRLSILAHLFELPSSNAQAVAWQPIDTAPEHEWVLCFAADFAPFTNFKHKGIWTNMNVQPTHWMPLPPLPTGDAKEA